MNKKEQIYIDKERGYVLIDLYNSPISAKKANTALYKFAGEGEFSNMALKNDFNSPLSEPVSRPLKEYIPVVSVGEICIYRHKSNNKYYVSTKTSGNPPHYTMKDTELKRLRLNFFWMGEKYFLKRMEFESPVCEILFLKYWKITI